MTTIVIIILVCAILAMLGNEDGMAMICVIGAVLVAIVVPLSTPIPVPQERAESSYRNPHYAEFPEPGTGNRAGESPANIREGASPSANISELSPWRTVTATAYCPCEKCCGDWASKPRKWFVGVPGVRIIAVDPKMIPLHSTVEIRGMGIYYAEDTGGSIKGNRIDIYFATHAEALEFGRRELEIRIIE